MADALYDFGLVSQLVADAVGLPGQRRFRLLVESERGSATLWMEKEQLQELGLAVQRLLAARRAPQKSGAVEQATLSAIVSGPAEFASLEFTVGQMALGYEASLDLILLTVFDIEAPDQERATLSLRATRSQSFSFAKNINAVVSAGRPRCPLCGQVLEGGHSCPGTNGHRQIVAGT